MWTPEAIDAFEYCQQGISNCQDLYFIEDKLWHRRMPLHGHSSAKPSSDRKEVRLFEDLLDNRPFIWIWRISTSHWLERYCDGIVIFKIKTSTFAMFPERKFTKECRTHCLSYVRTTCQPHKNQKKKQGRTAVLSALQPMEHLSDDVLARSQRSTTQAWVIVSCQVQAKAEWTLNIWTNVQHVHSTLAHAARWWAAWRSTSRRTPSPLTINSRWFTWIT